MATPAQKERVIEALQKNAKARADNMRKLEASRDVMLELVERAREMKIPMTQIAVACGMERRTLYDMLKTPRQPRVGAGAERNRT